MPPAALTWATARSVLTCISAPSTPVLVAWSSRTPSVIGDRFACEVVGEALPPQAHSASTPESVASNQRCLISVLLLFASEHRVSLFGRLQVHSCLGQLDLLGPAHPAPHSHQLPDPTRHPIRQQVDDHQQGQPDVELRLRRLLAQVL